MAGLDFSDDRVVQRYCHDILHGFFENVNNRRLNPKLKTWQESCAPNYTYAGLHGNFAEYEPVDLEGHLRSLYELSLSDPHFQLKVVDLWTSRHSGNLTTFMNYELIDAPKGLVRQSAGEIKWTFVEGKPKVLEVKTMIGPSW